MLNGFVYFTLLKCSVRSERLFGLFFCDERCHTFKIYLYVFQSDFDASFVRVFSHQKRRSI